MLSRFHLIPERYGRTDRRTDLLYQYRAKNYGVATRGEQWSEDTFRRFNTIRARDGRTEKQTPCDSSPRNA